MVGLVGFFVFITGRTDFSLLPLRVELENCFDRDCTESERLVHHLTRYWQRYDFGDSHSIFVDQLAEKNHQIFWKQKQTKTFSPPPNSAVQNVVEVEKCPTPQPLPKLTGECVRIRKGTDLLLSIWLDKASWWQNLLLQNQIEVKKDFPVFLTEGYKERVITHMMVESGDRFVRLTRLKEVRPYWAGVPAWLGLSGKPSIMRLPTDFSELKTVQDLQALPAEVREVLLKNEGVQVLEASPE